MGKNVSGQAGVDRQKLAWTYDGLEVFADCWKPTAITIRGNFF
jgi:hypothetical protein